MEETFLKIQYVERTKNIEFPENIELVLEEDYVQYPNVYTDEAFRAIQAYLLICPDADPKTIIDFVHTLNA